MSITSAPWPPPFMNRDTRREFTHTVSTNAYFDRMTDMDRGARVIRGNADRALQWVTDLEKTIRAAIDMAPADPEQVSVTIDPYDMKVTVTWVTANG